MKKYYIFLIFLVLSSFLLMIFGILDQLYFWLIIAISAVLTYKVLPRLKKEKEMTK